MGVCDIYSPCALGATINDDTIPQLKAKVIAGSANNQLKDTRHGDIIHEMGIVYAPDYVINAGGVINVADELNGYNHERALKKVDSSSIQVLKKLLKFRTVMCVPTYVAADRMVEERIERMRNSRSQFLQNGHHILSRR